MSEDRKRYTLYVFHNGPKSVLCGVSPEDRENDSCFFLPKSQVELSFFLMDKNGVETCDIVIPDWLALEKGLDPDLLGESCDDEEDDFSGVIDD